MIFLLLEKKGEKTRAEEANSVVNAVFGQTGSNSFVPANTKYENVVDLLLCWE